MKVTRKKAEEAVRTLLTWIGEDITSPELLPIPEKVVETLSSRFKGKNDDPVAMLTKSLSPANVEYKKHGMVFFPDLSCNFFCSHSLTLSYGRVHIAYLPNEHVIGINSMQRLVDLLCKQLQLQENLTLQLVKFIDKALKPRGSAAFIEANHFCAKNKTIKTHAVSGDYNNNTTLRQEFFALIPKN
jgi:GTP cyclohydrolase I